MTAPTGAVSTSFTQEQFDAVSGALGQRRGVTNVAASKGLAGQIVHRIKDHSAEAEAALARWAA